MSFLANYAIMEETQANFRRISNSTMQDLEEMNNRLEPLKQEWTGVAVQQYEVKKHEWTQHASVMPQELHTAVRALEKIEQNYMDGDRRAAKGFNY